MRWLYDVIMTSYEDQGYSFWYQWIEEVHTYTQVANIWVSSVSYRKSREGVATTPPSEDVLQKIPQEDEGLAVIDKISIFHKIAPNSTY